MKSISMIVIISVLSWRCVPLSHQSTPPGKIPTGDITAISIKNHDGEDLFSARLEWRAPKNTGMLSSGHVAKINGYIVQYSPSPDFDRDTEIVNVFGTTAVLYDLKAFTIYYVRIAARNNGKNQNLIYSGTVNFTTTVDNPYILNPPSSLTVGMVTPKEISVAFSPPNYEVANDGTTVLQVTGYRGIISRYVDFSVFREVVTNDPETTSITFQELQPNTPYYVKISSLSYSGSSITESDATNIVRSITTPQPGMTAPEPPKNVTIMGYPNVTGNSITVIWTPPDRPGISIDGYNPAKIVRYILNISTSEDFSRDNVFYTINAPGNTYLIKRLTPSQQYYIRVSAINDNDKTMNTSSFAYPEGGIYIDNPNQGKSVPPNIPTNATLKHVDVTGASFFWNLPTGVLPYGLDFEGRKAYFLGFEVELSANFDFSDKTRLIAKSTDGYTYTGEASELKTDKTYYVRIRTKNNNPIAGALQYSDWVYLNSFTTTTP